MISATEEWSVVVVVEAPIDGPIVELEPEQPDMEVMVKGPNTSPTANCCEHDVWMFMLIVAPEA